MQVNKSTTKNVESTFINIIIIYSGKKKRQKCKLQRNIKVQYLEKDGLKNIQEIILFMQIKEII